MAISAGIHPGLSLYHDRIAAMRFAILFLFVLTVQAETLIFQGFTLIDGNGGAPIADASMVVTDGRIAAIGPRGSVFLNAGQPAPIDLKGKYVIPGLFNMHCHLVNTK